MPNEAKIGEPVEVKVVARATADTQGKISLYRDGKLLGQKDVALPKGKSVYTFPQTITDAGAATFEARLETVAGVQHALVLEDHEVAGQQQMWLIELATQLAT